MSEETMTQWQEAEENLKSLNEKLSVALIDITLKDNLVKQHAKVAEEAVSGWEKAETEAMTLKQQLDSATQQKLALEDRVGHLDGALKECMRQLRHVRDEQEQKIHEAVMKKSREWDKVKFELEARIVELEQQLTKAKVENGEMSKSLQECSKALIDIREARTEAEAEAKVLQVKLESSERENAGLKYELRAFSKELDMKNDERDLSKKAAEAAHRQHLESVKKVAKLEAECQRLRGVVRKRLPGPAALAQMRLEVETLGKEAGEVKWKKSFGRGYGLPVSSSIECSNDNHQEQAQRENELLMERLVAMEEETKMLQEALSKRNSELQASRVMCAKTASKLSSVEEQLESFIQGRRLQKPALEMHLEGSVSGNMSNPPSLASISEDGNDGEASCAESWASALIAELDQFKKEKVAGNIEKAIGAHKFDLLDDFLEMERLASMPSTKLIQPGIGKLDGFTEKNVEGSFSSMGVQEERASLEAALAKRELELQAANQICADVSRKLASVQENLTALQSKNALNESALVILQEKLDMILEAQAEGADLQKVLEDVKCAMAASGVTLSDSNLCIRRSPGLEISNADYDQCQHASQCIESSPVKDVNSLSDSECKIGAPDPELATAVGRIVNLMECIAEESRSAQKFRPLEDNKLEISVREFAALVDQFLHGDTKIIELVTKLSSFLAHLRTISSCDSDAQVLQNHANSFDNQTPDTIQSNFFNNGTGKHSISEQKATYSLCSPVLHDDCDTNGELSSLQAEKATLESELKAELSRYAALEKDLIELNSEKANLEIALAATKEKLEHTRDQLSEMGQMMADLQLQLASAQESRKLAECELGAVASSRLDTESQLKATEIEMKKLSEKVDTLELELQQERMRHQDAENRCQDLQEQLQRKDRVFEYSKCAFPDEERIRQEREIAAAAGKLAECQQTILILGRQLKALASPVDSMDFSHETENVESGRGATFTLGQELFSRNESNERHAENGVLNSVWQRSERDRRFEQDAPWSPHSRSASWASEPENSSTANSRQKTSQWARSSRAFLDSYKANEPGSPTHADYMEGQLTMPSSSDTEASSPTRSPIKSVPHRNGIPGSLVGSDISKSLNVIEGESPTSSSSSSSSAVPSSDRHGGGFSRFFSRTRSSH